MRLLPPSHARFVRFLEVRKLAEVAQEFREMGGLNQISTTERILQIYGQALALLRFPPQGLGESALTRTLIGRYGVVVDGAYLEGDEDHAHLKEGEYQVLGVRPDSQEVRAPLQRYTMSPAQVELFRLGYGLELGYPSGEGFENVLAQFLEMMLLAGHNHFLAKLGGEKLVEEKSKQLSYEGVSVIQSSIRVEPENLEVLRPEAPIGWYQQIKERVDAKHAVVIINYDKDTAFADLIVLIPHAAVILIQADKYYYDQITSLSADDIKAELVKMGHPSLSADCGSVGLSAETFDQSQELNTLLRELVGLSSPESTYWVLVTAKPALEIPANAARVLNFVGTDAALYPISLPKRDAKGDGPTKLLSEITIKD